MNDEVWLLGATGRMGRAVAARLQQFAIPLVLAGRSRERLEALAADVGGSPRLLVGTLDTILCELSCSTPAVVVNAVGPFAYTAERVARACPPGTHYVDVGNELSALEAILALDRHAIDRGSVLVTGAGFGVLATESVVLRLCHGQPPAARARVDALASVAVEPGPLGTALAASIIENLPSGGQEIRDRRIIRTGFAAHPARLTTPDNDVATTASLPTGELLAAQRASNADNVVAASSLVPTGTAARLAFPVLSALMRIGRVRNVAINRLAAVQRSARERPRPHSWAHARVEWHSGEVREGWLRTGDGHDFTVAALTEVTRRLLTGEGQPGAHTPGALFGPNLALDAGADFIDTSTTDMTSTTKAAANVGEETRPVGTGSASARYVRPLMGLLWDVGIPVTGFYGLKLTGASDWRALLAATLFAGARVGWVALWSRRVTWFAAVMMLVFGVGVGLALLTGDPRLMLAKTSVLTALIGGCFLSSLATDRPLTLIAFQTWQPKHAAAWRESYQRDPDARALFRRAAVVWGIGLIAEAALRLPLIYLVPLQVGVGASTALFVLTLGGLTAWTAIVAAALTRHDRPTDTGIAS
jgi:short subunit dehydrogenase-like uncharacterized protein